MYCDKVYSTLWRVDSRYSVQCIVYTYAYIKCARTFYCEYIAELIKPVVLLGRCYDDAGSYEFPANPNDSENP